MRPKARGRFTLRANVTHHVMVATVTGVAPYVSMVRQSLHDRAADTGGRAGHRFFVMHGASHCDEFVYDSELRRLSEEHPHVIQYVSSVSRPSAARNAEWNGPVGRINTILEECLERRCESTSASRLVRRPGAVLASTETWITDLAAEHRRNESR